MKVKIILLVFFISFTLSNIYSQPTSDPSILAYKYVNLGNKYFKQNKLIKSVFCYKKAVKLNSKLQGAYVNLAIVYYKIGDYPAFVANIKKAARLGDEQSSRILNFLKL